MTKNKTQLSNKLSKIILHYDDIYSLRMLVENFEDYRMSVNSLRTGVSSTTIYDVNCMDHKKRSTSYFKRNKSGSITGRCWKNND